MILFFFFPTQKSPPTHLSVNRGAVMILFFSSNAKKPPYPPFGGQGGNKNIIFILTQKSPPTHLSVNRGAINIAETVVSSHYWDFCCRHWDLYCRYWDLEKTRDTSASTQPAKKKPRFQSTPQYSGSAGTAGKQIPLADQPGKFTSPRFTGAETVVSLYYWDLHCRY